MDGGSFTKVANGNVSPCRFVKLDTTAAGRAVLAGAGDRPFGISQKFVRNIAISGQFTSPDDGFAAVAGEMFNIHGQQGERCLIELGGTVTVGDPLKPGTNGVGVTAGTDKDKAGAIAEASGTTGQLIPCRIQLNDVAI